MSIIKDLINMSLMLALILLLYRTNNLYVALACCSVFIFLYCIKSVSNKKFIQKVANKEIEKQQMFFIEVLTHDLKTPTLAQLRGLELIQNEVLGAISDEQKELIVQIKDSCNYVLDMISQILRIYNLKNCVRYIKNDKVNMEELLFKSFEELDYAAKDKNIQFVYLASGVDTILEAESKDIKTAIMNLLMNAILYSDAGEKIFIKFERFSNCLKFEIITKGVILTEKECEDMFNSALSNVPQYSIIGHGINLYLCKIIADCYNGRIYAQTDGEIYNKFTLELPVIRDTELCSTSSILTSY